MHWDGIGRVKTARAPAHRSTVLVLVHGWGESGNDVGPVSGVALGEVKTVDVTVKNMTELFRETIR